MSTENIKNLLLFLTNITKLISEPQHIVVKGFSYFISCSNASNSSQSKKFLREIPNPSQSIFNVTIPGLRLFPYRIFFTVDDARYTMMSTLQSNLPAVFWVIKLLSPICRLNTLWFINPNSTKSAYHIDMRIFVFPTNIIQLRIYPLQALSQLLL